MLAPRREGVEYDVEPAADRFLIVHNTRHPGRRPGLGAVRRHAATSSGCRWLGSGEGERFVAVDAFDDATVLSLRTGGLTALRVLPRDPSSPSGHGEPWDVAVDQPVHSIGLGDNPEPAQRAIQVVVESWATPRTVLDVDLATRAAHPAQAPAGARATSTPRTTPSTGSGPRHPTAPACRSRWCAASGSRPTARNPGVVTAYGSYEISSDPYFSVARLSLLDRGVVYAVAHVRGGGEMGRRWYDDGKLLAKTNTFTDTLAAVDHLVASGWVAPDRVGLEGGSAGGLLVGAVLNLAPERFRVAHAAVPFVDALTTMLQPDLPLTVGEWEEWGNPLADPEVYAAMRAYAPYENVRAADYPAVLATSSLHDTRVYVTEPAKWVARLRETVTSDPVDRPVLLRTELAAGHGGRSGRYCRVGADRVGVGVRARPAGRHRPPLTRRTPQLFRPMPEASPSQGNSSPAKVKLPAPGGKVGVSGSSGGGSAPG